MNTLAQAYRPFPGLCYIPPCGGLLGEPVHAYDSTAAVAVRNENCFAACLVLSSGTSVPIFQAICGSQLYSWSVDRAVRHFVVRHCACALLLGVTDTCSTSSHIRRLCIDRKLPGASV